MEVQFMEIDKVAITGCSGFYGRAVIAALRRRCSGVEIHGLDVVPPQDHPPDHFVCCDVLSQEFTQHIAAFRPDTVIHLAFIVNPIRDEERMHTVNVRGTEAVLQATAAAEAQRLLVASSATAYGAWPDNPVPMTEDQPLRPRAEYRYADDKVKVERLLETFAEQHSGIAVSWTRPCMIYGPGLSNYLTEFILNGPLIALPGGNDTQLQFIHVDDVADGSVSILQADARGAFNLAPDDWFTLRDLAQWSGRRCVGVPLAFCLLFTKIWWALRLPWFSFPSGLWYFIRYPWVVSPARMERELNFRCRMSSREVVTQLLQDAGKCVMQPVFGHELPEQAGTTA
jgi:UDP-glucose 4-epimerase